MQSVSKKLIILAAALLVLNCHNTIAQQYHSAVTIRGFVPPLVSLSVGGGPDFVVRASGRDFALIELSGYDEITQFRIPLELRTNIAYELKLTLESAEGCLQKIVASIEGVHASGRLVAEGASQIRQRAISIDGGRPGFGAALMIGPRISVRGNLASPNNALLGDLELRFQRDGGCHWRALLRISVSPYQ
jgi:hypothetical protein